jgi:hypothetical protein
MPIVAIGAMKLHLVILQTFGCHGRSRELVSHRPCHSLQKSCMHFAKKTRV